MKRIIYLICQTKSNGKPQALSDGEGKLLYVYASKQGYDLAQKEVKKLNRDRIKQPVHLREAQLIIGKKRRYYRKWF